jgi:hypothetical protein
MTPANRDAFAHMSHTFTHLNLNNATYDDAAKEIIFNQAWLKQLGLDAGKFSPAGLIPPAITGVHNGDVIKAWLDNGITNVVGDNSRPVLMNPDNVHHLLHSTVESNGLAGLNIMPRWPTAIYYDCDTQLCTTQEWTDTSAGTGKFADLLAFERDVTTRYLFGLRHDPYMFHQANMRATGVGSYKVGSQTVNSLLQIWVETVVQEMTRLTAWPSRPSSTTTSPSSSSIVRPAMLASPAWFTLTLRTARLSLERRFPLLMVTLAALLFR